MKAILKFNLPEETTEFNLASRAIGWYSSLWELDQWLRSQMKYHDASYSQEEWDVLEKVRHELHDIMLKNHITFDDVE